MEDFGIYTGLEAGGGIGQSGSVSVSVGNFKSLEDAKGTYGCIGGSGGTSGFSIGGDAIISKNGIVGLAFSVGLGVGEKAEGHCRIGYTGIKSFKGEIWMNKTSEFKKIITAFFSMIILLIGGITFAIVTGTDIIFFVCFIYAIVLFFIFFSLLPINDLLINS